MEAEVNIIIISNYTATPRNIITEYGRLAMEDIEANIHKFIRQHSRQAHNYVQLFHCLTKSMTEAAHLKIVAESDKYMDIKTPVGRFLLKLIIQIAVINTRETAIYLRYNLANLDTYMFTVNSDI